MAHGRPSHNALMRLRRRERRDKQKFYARHLLPATPRLFAIDAVLAHFKTICIPDSGLCPRVRTHHRSVDTMLWRV